MALATSACSTIREYTMPAEENLMSGAGSIMVKKPANGAPSSASGYELIDIDELLKSYGLNEPGTVATKIAEGEKGYEYRRNDLQDRLLAASNQRCGDYLRILTSSNAQTQMTWGGLATLLSGAASVTSPASVAKALAAGSTVSNGVLSMYNEAYFSNLTINVISTGISKRREGILQQLTELRKNTMVDYPVNRAIADALTYHSACNIISGLETAASATNNTNQKVTTTAAAPAAASGSATTTTIKNIASPVLQ